MSSSDEPDSDLPLCFDLTDEQRPFESLLSFIDSLQVPEINYKGPVTLQRGDKSTTCDGVASWKEDGGRLTCIGENGDIGSLAGGGAYGKAIRADDYLRLSFGDWYSLDCFVNGIAYDEKVTTHCRFNKIFRGQESADGVAHLFLYQGITFDVLPHGFPSSDRRAMSADGFVSTAFNRPLLVRQTKARDSENRPFLAVAYLGDRLSARQISSIYYVLCFLCGREGFRIADAEFDAAGAETFRGLFRTSLDGIATRARPPVFLFNGWRDILAVLPEMFERYHTLLDRDIPIDVALRHLLETDGTLDEQLRAITSSLNSLIESPAFKPVRARVIAKRAFNDFVEHDLMPYISDQIFAKGFPGELIGNIAERLRSANNIKHSERRKQFWSEVDFQLGPLEKTALATRDPLAHQGFFLRDPSDEQFDVTLELTQTARTLVNKVILALLGYRRPIFDYVTGISRPFDEVTR